MNSPNSPIKLFVLIISLLFNSFNNLRYKLINSSFAKSSEFILLRTYSAIQQLLILQDFVAGQRLFPYLKQLSMQVSEQEQKIILVPTLGLTLER